MPRSVLFRKDLRFDSRLAVFHEKEHWLAVADLHYGYELSLRAAGALFPAWGMRQIEERLDSLVAEYRPRTLLMLGDLVHTKHGEEPFLLWLTRLEHSVPEIVLLRGNHDRHLLKLVMHDSWRIGRHLFHHGHHDLQVGSGDLVFCGHWHPAKTVSDGAGFSRNLPALCRTASGWILPAFSPWAVGGAPSEVEILDRWISNQKKVWKIMAK